MGIKFVSGHKGMELKTGALKVIVQPGNEGHRILFNKVPFDVVVIHQPVQPFGHGTKLLGVGFNIRSQEVLQGFLILV